MFFVFFTPSVLAGSDTKQLIILAEVVSTPCSLRVGDENIHVDFGNVLNKTLLRDGRTIGNTFFLHLDECDTSIARSVKITFTGQGSEYNSDFLALSANSTAKGISIGFEKGGALLPINKPSRGYILQKGSNILEITAFLQLLTPNRQGFLIGSFDATANFVLDYD